MDRKIRTLCVVTAHYPSPENPRYAFLGQLTREFVAQGLRCVVVAPQSVSRALLRGVRREPRSSADQAGEGVESCGEIAIYRPPFVSFSVSALGFDSSALTYRSFVRATLGEIGRHGIEADAFYGQFVFPSGICAAQLGDILGKPSFIANGESASSLYERINPMLLARHLNKVTGIVSVSTKNGDDLARAGALRDRRKIGTFPNGVDLGLFAKADRAAARRSLSIAEDAFVVAFVGGFIERKGIKELCAALNSLEGVHSIFVGAGDVEPDCDSILFKGSLPHREIPRYLNAADLFVLPTREEGCCNAILEALACGLPVVSSDLPFNDPMLDESNSIRVDPRDAGAIARAISSLRADVARRERMGRAAEETARRFDVRRRARDIIAFMESMEVV
jgi:teichuronic acid biosynthesis glycosyltransferase TuaC